LSQQRGNDTIGELLVALTRVGEEILALLRQADPPLDTLEVLMGKRSALFTELQGCCAGRSPVGLRTPSLVALAGPLAELDAECVKLARAHVERVAGLLDHIKDARQAVRAYAQDGHDPLVRGQYVDCRDSHE
jgi:hypothetical protein